MQSSESHITHHGKTYGQQTTAKKRRRYAAHLVAAEAFELGVVGGALVMRLLLTIALALRKTAPWQMRTVRETKPYYKGANVNKRH
jgi:hypothetical protein